MAKLQDTDPHFFAHRLATDPNLNLVYISSETDSAGIGLTSDAASSYIYNTDTGILWNSTTTSAGAAVIDFTSGGGDSLVLQFANVDYSNVAGALNKAASNSVPTGGYELRKNVAYTVKGSANGFVSHVYKNFDHCVHYDGTSSNIYRQGKAVSVSRDNTRLFIVNDHNMHTVTVGNSIVDN